MHEGYGGGKKARHHFLAAIDESRVVGRKRAAGSAKVKSSQTFLRLEHDGEGTEAADKAYTQFLIATGLSFGVGESVLLEGLVERSYQALRVEAQEQDNNSHDRSRRRVRSSGGRKQVALGAQQTPTPMWESSPDGRLVWQRCGCALGSCR